MAQPPAANQGAVTEADRVRADRYQRYLRDLRAHEQSQNEPEAPAPPPGQPGQQRAAGPGAENPQQPGSVPDADVDETIERYLEQSRQQDHGLHQNDVAAQPDPTQAGYDQGLDNYDPDHPSAVEDDWRNDIADEYESRGDYYTPAAEQPPAKPRRRGFVILGALAGLAIVGGALWWAYSQGFGLPSTDSENVPVVQAEETPTKIAPKDPGGTKIPQQTKLIYDRIVGNDVIVKEKIVPREETVVAAPRAIEPTTVAPASTPPAEPAKPALPQVQVEANNPAAAAPPPSTQRVVTPSQSPNENATAPDLPKVIITPPGSTPPAPTAAPPVPQAPAAPPAPRVAASPRAITPPAAPAARRIRPPVPKPVVQAQAPARTRGGPIQLTPVPAVPSPVGPSPNRQASAPQAIGPAAPARPAPVQQARAPAGAGTYAVQVASFRSQAEANNAFRRLKQRHAALLNPYGSLIQRADLGSRGIFFRLRLGPVDGKQRATELCNALVSAGEKGCIVSRQ